MLQHKRNDGQTRGEHRLLALHSPEFGGHPPEDGSEEGVVLELPDATRLAIAEQGVRAAGLEPLLEAQGKTLADYYSFP